MPTTPVAQLIRGTSPFGAQPPTLVDTPLGSEGTRDYLINTGDETFAATALGLPLPNDPWDLTNRPSLLVRRRTIKRVGGKDNALTSNGANCLAHVEYQTPQFRGGQPTTAKAGDKFTVLTPGVTSIQRMYAIDAVAGDPPIAEGRGVSVNIGTTRAIVTKYIQQVGNTPIVDFARLIGITDDQAINSDTCTLPPVQGTNISITGLTAGMVQYVVYDVTPANSTGLVKVVHTLNLARDFLATWQTADFNGNYSAIPKTANVYPTAVLADLLA